MSSAIDRAKYAAAQRAAAMVEDGMLLGLGTGSTASVFIRCLGARIAQEGLSIRAMPTSERSAELGREMGIDVITFDAATRLDLTVDGCDEFDDDLLLIKGGGGALLREKIVAAASDRMVAIADRSKHVAALGAFPLPVEIVRFGWQATKRLLEEPLAALDVMGEQVALRMNGDDPYITDGGNLILDLHLGHIGDARQLALLLNQIPGVVETGLFVDLCDMVVVGGADGRVTLKRAEARLTEEDRVALPGDANVFRDV